MIPENIAAPAVDAVQGFAQDVRRDLALDPKQLQSKYLYDGLGSSLFEAICYLPWYRITRAEARLLRRVAVEVVAACTDPVTLVELGCGFGEKLAMVAEALRSRRRAVSVHLIDISPVALEHSERALGRLEYVSVVGHRATYEEGLRHAARDRQARRLDARPLPRLEHRQLRHARRPGLPGRDPGGPAARRRAAAGRRPR